MTSKALEAAASEFWDKVRRPFSSTQKFEALSNDAQHTLKLTVATIIRAFAENITDEMVEAFIATLHENQNTRGQNRQDAYRATTRAAILRGLVMTTRTPNKNDAPENKWPIITEGPNVWFHVTALDKDRAGIKAPDGSVIELANPSHLKGKHDNTNP